MSTFMIVRRYQNWLKILKSDNVTVAIGKSFGDGAYDSNDIFRYLEDNGILPCIKVRKTLELSKKKGTFLETYQF
jgi:hypothetical protein